MECGCPSEVDAAPGFVYVQRSYDDKYDASAFCGYDTANKAIIASFRGTASLTNWKANLKFAKAAATTGMGTACDHPYPQSVRVHQGFYDTYSSVAPEIVSTVVHLTKEYPDFQVYVTGHSMG
jgi:triacylglycerol lipase